MRPKPSPMASGRLMQQSMQQLQQSMYATEHATAATEHVTFHIGRLRIWKVTCSVAAVACSVAAVACSVACSVARTLYKGTWVLNGMCSHMLVFEVTALSLSSKAVLVVRHGPVFIYKRISSNLN
jgi:hypothetical protein